MLGQLLALTMGPFVASEAEKIEKDPGKCRPIKDNWKRCVGMKKKVLIDLLNEQFQKFCETYQIPVEM
jgi:hypothetical protein